MMNERRPKLTLDRPVTYQIKVAGELKLSWSPWTEGVTIIVERVEA